MAAPMLIPTDDYTTYSDVPVMRRRWFWFTSMLVLTPIGIILALTGPIYAKSEDKIQEFTRTHRNKVAAVFTFMIALNIIRAFIL